MPDLHSPVTDIVPFDPLAVTKRRSCELVHTPSPCVKKALFHLNRLKGLMKLAGKGEPVFVDSPSNQEMSIKKQLRFASPTLSVTESEYDQVFDKEEISINGTGGALAQLEELAGEGFLKKIQLTPHEVFTQVGELILRLEYDRAMIERALARERGRIQKLSLKIEEMSRRRLIQLPCAVQQEHDACALDISELQWHVSYTERQLERSKDNVSAAQVLNDSLKEDIEFVRKHCPLVEEKLTLEKEEMQKIKAMQQQTDEELASARIVLQKAEAAYEEAVARAEEERKATKGDLDAVSNQLWILKKDLSRSEALCQAYKKKSEQSQDKIASQKEDLINIKAKIEVVREQDQQEFYRIEELKGEIKQVEYETGELNNQKREVEETFNEMHSQMKAKTLGLEFNYKENLKTLRTLQETNRDLKFDIEDMLDQIKICDKSAEKSERELERYSRDRERCEQQLKTANDEVANVAMINRELKNQLEKEEIKTQSLEDALKGTSENLRKQVNEEMRQKTLLEAKRHQNSKALKKGKTENVKKKRRIEQNLEETKTAMTKAAAEVERLQNEHDAALQTVLRLESQLATINEEHETTEKTLTAEKVELEPEESKLQEEQILLKEKIKEMEFEELQMTQKLEDMKVSQSAMQRRINLTANQIEILNDEYDELLIQLSCSEKTNSNLEAQLEEAKKRFVDRESQHNQVMKERQMIKKQLEEDIKSELTLNHEVAMRYRQLQSQHLDMKNQLMTLYDSKVKLEVSIKDHKQLTALQQKLNHALSQYYHDRAEYNKAGLAKFHVRSEENSEMMVNVRQGLEVAIGNITQFLKSQIDGSAVDQVHQAAMTWLQTDPA